MLTIIDQLAKDVAETRDKKGWKADWSSAGCYLHLEASELIESIRGKGGDPLDEAGDVLFMLMSITENEGIPFSDVVKQLQKKLTKMNE